MESMLGIGSTAPLYDDHDDRLRSDRSYLRSLGLYSLLAYAVSLRTREIGVRVALGAAPGQVAALILREGLTLAMVGVCLGLTGAYFLTRFMHRLIFGIQAFDITTFAAISLLLTAMAIVATCILARALRVNRSEALRAE